MKMVQECLLTHDLHDVVTVGDETKRQRSGENSELPNGNRGLGLRCFTSVPGTVDDSPRTDSVSNIVGAVSEGGSAGSEDLDERVGVLDLVGVLLSVAVDALHTATFGSTVDTSLGSVNVIVDTVESTDNNHSRDALESDEHVLLLVDLTSLDLVLVEVAHGPGERSTLVPELGVEALLTLGDELLVAELRVLGDNYALLSVVVHDTLFRVVVVLRLLHLLVVLDNGVVGDNSSFGAFNSRAFEKKRSLEDVVPTNGVIALDDLGV
jgi:hypothetical protein